MLPYYLGSLALGGVLIAASLLMGDADFDGDVDADFDADADADADFDADADADADAAGGSDLVHIDDPTDLVAGRWIPFLSLRFWTFALASFGLTGSILSVLGVGSLLTAGAASVLGMIIGVGAAWTFRTLSRNQISGNVDLRQLAGTHAKVLIPMVPGKTGKIRMLVDGQHVDLLAHTQSDQPIKRKSSVLIVDIQDGVANVTPLPDDYTEPTKES